MFQMLSRTIAAALVISLLLHLGIWQGLDLFEPQALQLAPKPIEIEVLDPEEQKKVQSREKENLRQVVEQDTKPLNDEAPEDSRFLSRFNQRVEKETKASHHGDFTNAGKRGERTQGQQNAQKTKPKKETAQDDGTLPSLKDLSPSFSMTPKADAVKEVDQQGLASQTNDHLEGVEQGMETILNTREFVYYSYYQRIREKIRQYWEPKIREKVKKIFATGRSIASSTDRITKVIIVLDKQGSLIKVQIVGESGIQDLDEAAVEAFRAAEPFPNPPDGIIETDGLIRIRWDFVLEASSHWPEPTQERYVAQR